jgi:hypothetical protein
MTVTYLDIPSSFPNVSYDTWDHFRDFLILSLRIFYSFGLDDRIGLARYGTGRGKNNVIVYNFDDAQLHVTTPLRKLNNFRVGPRCTQKPEAGKKKEAY